MESPQQEGLAALQKQQYEPSIAESNIRSIASQPQQLIAQFKEYEAKSEAVHMDTLHNSDNTKVKRFKESVFYGEIINQRRHGQGIMLYNNGRLYEGQWECDYKQGMGYEKFPNGSIYQGYYVNGKPEGVGKYTWANGQFYEGEWVNGLKHGSGMWQGAKGDSYVGEWRLGKADGYGVHVWVNGDRYEGYFRQCLKQGEGTQKFANGDLYKGEYVRGKPNGYGEYYWHNGSYFKGSFKDGLRQGHGMWKKSGGLSDKYQGEYCQDKKQGYGIFTWASGNVYKGHYRQDVRHGFGQMYWSDGSYYKGNWGSGIQNGQGVMFTPGQGTKQGVFKDNILVDIYSEEPDKVKSGSIKKNSPANSTTHNPHHLQPIQEKELGYKSLEHRKKANTTFDFDSNPRTKEFKVPPLPRQPPKPPSAASRKSNKAGVAELPQSLGKGKKERIPHSAYYMHKLHKRVTTAQNQGHSNSVYARQNPYMVPRGRSKGQIMDELKNFTKKMAAQRPSRMSSHHS